MARRVFFSFHHVRDVFRGMQVRHSWVVRPGDSTQPFYDKAEFEQVKRSYVRGKGLLAIDIRNILHPQSGVDVQGANPLSRPTINQSGSKVPLSRIYRSYDWVGDDGRQNMPAWIEATARAAGR